MLEKSPCSHNIVVLITRSSGFRASAVQKSCFRPISARRTVRYTSATLTDRTSKSSRSSIRSASILSGHQMGKASSIASMRAAQSTSFSTILNLVSEDLPSAVVSMASVHVPRGGPVLGSRQPPRCFDNEGWPLHDRHQVWLEAQARFR